MVARSQLGDANPALRFDAEFFGRQSIDAIEHIRSLPNLTLVDLVDRIQHPTEVPREYVDDGLDTLMAGNIKPNRAEASNLPKMAFGLASAVARNKLREGDVLLVRTGANYGTVAPWKHGRDVFACADLLVARTPALPAGYLSSFLSGRFGKPLVDRCSYGSAQPHISPTYVGLIPIPRLGKLEMVVDELVDQAVALERISESAQLEAETSLLDALGLRDWSPPEPLTYTRAASAVVEARRLDAQFHAPAVLALRAKLEEKFELTSLDALGEVTNGRTVQYSEQGSVPIMRSGDVGKARDLIDLLRADASEPIFIVQRGDVLISSIGFGSIGRVEAIDTDAALGTVSEVTVVRQNKVDAHYLTAFLRSFAGQLQLERLITGATGQLHLYPRDVRVVFVPVLGEEAQLAQRTWAEAANAQRVRSAQLLEVAKRAVEIAVEQDEAAALRFISEQGEGTNASSA